MTATVIELDEGEREEDLTVARPPLKPDGQIDYFRLYVGFAAMIVGQFLALLDIQIVSASLPQIQTGVDASADTVSWIQTSYLIAEVVAIPLSGYLSRVFGTQKVFMAAVAAFLITSMMAGMSGSLDVMLAARALQGFAGGVIMPTVFAIAFTAFPVEKRSQASIMMGMVLSLSPTLGPTLGGYITEWLSWRWVFFVNVPPGLLVLMVVARYANFDRGDARLTKGFDWPGLATMAVFLVSLQYVVEEGPKDGWFQDDLILWLTVFGAIAGGAFVWRQLTYHRPIVELRAFRDRNFSVGILLTMVSGMGLFGSTFLLPLFLARIRHYTASQIGLTMIVSGATMFLCGPVLRLFVFKSADPRLVIFLGYMVSGYGLWLGHAVTPQWGFWEFALVQMLRSLGVITAIVGVQNVTMATLPPSLVKSGSGLMNLSRMTGGAIGLAVLSSTLAQQQVVHFQEITSRLSYTDPGGLQMLSGLSARLETRGVAEPTRAALKMLHNVLQRDAATLAFGDAFALLAVVTAGAGLLALVVGRGNGASGR
ncbi:MAG: DHA2 family efflux MFS transporter permease subunit [Ignavibacteriales bacterium]